MRTTAGTINIKSQDTAVSLNISSGPPNRAAPILPNFMAFPQISSKMAGSACELATNAAKPRLSVYNGRGQSNSGWTRYFRFSEYVSELFLHSRTLPLAHPPLNHSTSMADKNLLHHVNIARYFGFCRNRVGNNRKMRMT
jgi:hypothetical protein